MSSRLWLALLAAAVLAALVGLALLSRSPGESPAPGVAGPAPAADPPTDTAPRRAPARQAIAAGPRDDELGAIDDGVAADADADADDRPGRYADDEGRLVADHRGKGPPEDGARSAISGRDGAALRIALRPEVDACADSLTDREAAAGSSFSVTLRVSVRDGRYVVESPSVASRQLAEKPFFACIEDRLEGLSMPAPGSQQATESQRLTFPYRVP